MRRTAARIDSNQTEIIQALRKVGASVAPTHMVGKGFPDIVVGFRGSNHLLEIKDGDKARSKRKLTDDERDWHLTWQGDVRVVESVNDALKAIGAL